MCPSCDAALPRIERRMACPSCGAPYGALVCTECWSTEFSFEAAVSLGELDGPLARAVVMHKDAGERRLGEFLGGLLAHRVAEQWVGWADAVCWIPPTREAVRRRGFDHGRPLAEQVAIGLETELTPLLSRARARDQRRLGRSERLASAGGTFAVRGRAPARVVVVDDVLTTGATLDAAADSLLANGADAVRVAVVARAW